ncbi:MAG: transketolase [Lachnospiraceae bacterium]|nr:transketolase [Lachnospiraceae bacterium]
MLNASLKEHCLDIRCDTIRAIGHLGVGHIGGCLSVIELLTVLYFEAMNIDPAQPKMPGRDRFICSKGHAGPAVYAALANRGFFPKEMLLTLNRGGTDLPSHCDMNRTPGVDMTTGSLGQGFSCAVGAALGSKLEGDGAVIYTLIGDGESQEGQIWEAAMFAAAKKLDNLIAFTDYNKLQIDDTVEKVNDIAPLAAKWHAFGWNVVEVENGNDLDAVLNAVGTALSMRGEGSPTMVILHTKKGCGVPEVEAMGAGNHNCPFSEAQAEAAIRALREAFAAETAARPGDEEDEDDGPAAGKED